MNILVFSWRDPKHPLAGGAEQVMHEHMKGWVLAGNKVTLFSSKVKGRQSQENLDGINIIRGGYQYLGVQFAAFSYYLKNNRKFDFIVDQFHGVPFFTPLYCRKPKIAVIQEPARDVWLKNQLPIPINLIVGVLGFVFEPLFFLFYKNVIFMTGSNSAKDNLSEYGIDKNKIFVVPHGVVIPERLKIQRKPKEKTVTYLGMISKDKGIEDAIRVFKILSKYDYRFWVIGGAETENYLTQVKEIAHNIGVLKRIKFWGRVSGSGKFKLLSKSWVLINPSVHEGWGLVNIEANYVGTPVVAYKSPGLIDSVKNGVSGEICDKSPEDMSKKVISVLEDGRNYAKLSKGARKWSEQFNWEKSRKISIKLINGVYLGDVK